MGYFTPWGQYPAPLSSEEIDEVLAALEDDEPRCDPQLRLLARLLTRLGRGTGPTSPTEEGADGVVSGGSREDPPDMP